MFHTITLNEFHQAIANGDYPLVKQYILHHDGNYAAINAKLGNDIPPIALAIIKEQAQIAKFLLNNGVDVNAAASGKGVTPLFLACAKGNLDVVRALLVVSGIVINTIHFSGYNPLEAAALQGHAQIVLALLAAGAYIQDYDIFIPALQERGHEEIAEIMSAWNDRDLTSKGLCTI